MEANDIKAKAAKGAERFLERKGHEVLSVDWACGAGKADIVSREPEDGSICFASVRVRTDSDGFPEEPGSRADRDQAERVAACWLGEHDVPEAKIRFDAISVVVISEHRAFLRMHTNVFGVDSL